MNIHCSSGKNQYFIFCFILSVVLLHGCSSVPEQSLDSSAAIKPSTSSHADYLYIIGPGDVLDIFVWKNPEVSTSVIVRPDGMINAPLVDDIKVSDKKPSEVAKDIEAALAEYIREPIVTVTVNKFIGPYHEQVRVIGEAANPMTLAYHEDMTLLDVIIAVNGLTEFADGNGALLSRVIDEQYQQFNIRIDDLLQDGDMSANVDVLPGDIIVIPESWF